MKEVDSKEDRENFKGELMEILKLVSKNYELLKDVFFFAFRLGYVYAELRRKYLDKGYSNKVLDKWMREASREILYEQLRKIVEETGKKEIFSNLLLAENMPEEFKSKVVEK